MSNLRSIGIIGRDGSGWAAAADALGLRVSWTVTRDPYDRYADNLSDCFGDAHRIIDQIDGMTEPVDAVVIVTDARMSRRAASEICEKSIDRLREMPSLVIVEGLDGSRSMLRTAFRTKTGSLYHANLVAARLSSLGYYAAAYWSDHAALGATATRVRWTAQFTSGALLPEAGVVGRDRRTGWFDRLRDLLEPSPKPSFFGQYFEPCDPAPWQRARMERFNWPYTPFDTLMLHASYTGSKGQAWVNMARNGSEPAYAPQSMCPLRYRATRVLYEGKSYRLTPLAVARIMDFEDGWLLPQDRSEALQMLGRTTSPIAAASHLSAHMGYTAPAILDSALADQGSRGQLSLPL
jgi:hypothetical protein